MFQKPSVAELREAAHALGMHPSEDYLLAVDEIVAPLAKAYAALDGIADELPAEALFRDRIPAGYRQIRVRGRLRVLVMGQMERAVSTQREAYRRRA